jgi:hypothetical protein
LGKKFYNSLKTGPNFFLQHLKNKVIFIFVKFLATKKGLTTNFFSPLSLLLFLDPGSGTGKNQDPGSGINGSATLSVGLFKGRIELIISFEVLPVAVRLCIAALGWLNIGQLQKVDKRSLSSHYIHPVLWNRNYLLRFRF